MIFLEPGKYKAKATSPIVFFLFDFITVEVISKLEAKTLSKYKLYYLCSLTKVSCVQTASGKGGDSPPSPPSSLFYSPSFQF